MRLGLLGGTFDPPHIGHLIAAQDALQALSLDRVAFLPAALPPHKRARRITAAGHRLAMLELATGDDVRFTIEALELHRAGPSFTVDTLRDLAARGDELVLLIGTDQYAEFDSWREPAEILRLASLGVLRRAGEELASTALAGQASPGAVYDVPVTRVDVSSTLIREALAAGRSVRYLVPPAVVEYIDRNSLYRSDPEAAAEGGIVRDTHMSFDDRP